MKSKLVLPLGPRTRKFNYCLLPIAYCLLFILILLPHQPAVAGETLLEVKSELNRLIKMSQINPEDELLKLRIRQYALAKGLQVPNLPVSEARDRFQRTLLKDNLAVVTAARAIEGTLQLETMRQRIDQLQPKNIKISTLQPLEIRSNDYKTMLIEKGASRSIPKITTMVPEDKIYLGFKNFSTLYHFISLWDAFAVPAINYLMTSIHLQDLRWLLESRLGISEKTFMGPEWDKVEEIALLLGDPYLHEGTDITLVIQFSQKEAVKLAWEALSKERQSYIEVLNPAFPQEEKFIKSIDDYLIVSNNLQVAEKIQTGQGKKLAEAEDFLYIYNLNLLGKDGFFFLGEGLIRKLTSPEFKIKELRRHACQLTLTDLQNALALSSTERTSSKSVTLSNLVTDGYLPYLPFCPDGGEYHLDESGRGFACSVHGRLGSLTHLESLPIDMITQIEHTEYERFKAQYQRYFTQFIDPIGVGIHLGDTFLQLSVIVLPLISDPLYTNVLQYIGQNVAGSREDQGAKSPGFFIFNHITPNYGIAIGVRSSLLKNILDRGWAWRSNYDYFHRRMLPYLDDATIFGDELVVGIFDFRFPESFPKTLKELAQAQIEVPLFLIQNLNAEEKAWEYLRALFQLATVESYKGTEIRQITVAGRLKIYGSVVRKLFVLSTSSETIRRIIDFPQISPDKDHLIEGISMPEVDLRTEINFDKIPQLQGYLFQLVMDHMKWSCKKNLVTLQNLLELSGSPEPGLSDAEAIQELLQFGGIQHPLTCPQGGKYYVENVKVYCSVHNSIEKYVEHSELTEKFFLLPLFAKLERLLAQLNLTEDGILSHVSLFLQKDD